MRKYLLTMRLLYLSLFLNFLFIVCFFCVYFFDGFSRSDNQYVSRAVEKYQYIDKISEIKNNEVESLVELLADTDAKCCGRLFRDFVVGELLTRCIDIHRAVGFIPSYLELSVGDGLIRIPDGFIDRDFDNIIKFLRTEKYPYTITKLREILLDQYLKNSIDQGLLSYFCNTEEFLFYQFMLNQNGVNISNGILAKIIIINGIDSIIKANKDYKNDQSSYGSFIRDVCMHYAMLDIHGIEILWSIGRHYVLHAISDNELRILLSVVSKSDIASVDIFEMLHEISTSARPSDIITFCKRIIN